MVSGYILFIIGIIIFFIRPRLVPLYYLLWTTMLIIICNMLFPMTFEESNMVGHVHSTNYIWLCGLLTIAIHLKKLNKNEKIIVITLLCLFLYVFILGLSRGVLGAFQGWLRTFFCFVPLWFLVKYHNIKFESYGNYIIYSFVIEFALVLFQTISGLYPSYTNGEYAENGAVNIVGTFRRYNEFADNMCLLILSLIFIYYKKQNFIPKYIFFTFLAIGISLVAIAGARTELAAIIVSLSVVIYFGFPQWRKKIFIVGLLGLIILGAGYRISLEKDTSISANESNYNRQLQLLDFLEGEGDVTEESTLFLSVFLLGEYFSSPDNMLTGPGLLFTNINGYYGLVTVDYHRCDSFLALLLCETGIVGYIILISFLVLIIRNSKEKLFPIATLLYLLIISITDFGLFQGYSAIYWLLIVSYSKPLSKKNK